MLGPYRKLVAYVVATIVLMIHRHWGLDLSGTEQLWTELIMIGGELLLAGGGGYAVWRVPNDPLPTDSTTK